MSRSLRSRLQQQNREVAEVARCSRRQDVIAEIAKAHLGLETLETRNSDSLDFKEQAVWSLKAALQTAYEAGRASVRSV